MAIKDITLPYGMKVKDPDALAQAVLNLLRDGHVYGRCGHTNLPAVKCDVKGLTLGHIYDLAEAVGEDVMKFVNAEKKEPEKTSE